MTVDSEVEKAIIEACNEAYKEQQQKFKKGYVCAFQQRIDYKPGAFIDTESETLAEAARSKKRSQRDDSITDESELYTLFNKARKTLSSEILKQVTKIIAEEKQLTEKEIKKIDPERLIDYFVNDVNIERAEDVINAAGSSGAEKSFIKHITDDIWRKNFLDTVIEITKQQFPNYDISYTYDETTKTITYNAKCNKPVNSVEVKKVTPKKVDNVKKKDKKIFVVKKDKSKSKSKEALKREIEKEEDDTNRLIAASQRKNINPPRNNNFISNIKNEVKAAASRRNAQRKAIDEAMGGAETFPKSMLESGKDRISGVLRNKNLNSVLAEARRKHPDLKYTNEELRDIVKTNPLDLIFEDHTVSSALQQSATPENVVRYIEKDENGNKIKHYYDKNDPLAKYMSFFISLWNGETYNNKGKIRIETHEIPTVYHINDEKNKDSSNEYKNTLELLVSTIIAEQSEEQSAKVKENIEKLKSVVKERFGSLCSALEEVDEHNAGSMPVGDMYVKNLIKTVKPSDMCMLLLDDEEWEKVQTESRAEVEKILKKNDRALDYFKKHFVNDYGEKPFDNALIQFYVKLGDEGRRLGKWNGPGAFGRYMYYHELYEESVYQQGQNLQNQFYTAEYLTLKANGETLYIPQGLPGVRMVKKRKTITKDKNGNELSTPETVTWEEIKDLRDTEAESVMNFLLLLTGGNIDLIKTALKSLRESFKLNREKILKDEIEKSLSGEYFRVYSAKDNRTILKLAETEKEKKAAKSLQELTKQDELFAKQWGMTLLEYEDIKLKNWPLEKQMDYILENAKKKIDKSTEKLFSRIMANTFRGLKSEKVKEIPKRRQFDVDLSKVKITKPRLKKDGTKETISDQYQRMSKRSRSRLFISPVSVMPLEFYENLFNGQYEINVSYLSPKLPQEKRRGNTHNTEQSVTVTDYDTIPMDNQDVVPLQEKVSVRKKRVMVRTSGIKKFPIPKKFSTNFKLPFGIPMKVLKRKKALDWYGTVVAATFFQLLISNTPVDEEYYYDEYRNIYEHDEVKLTKKIKNADGQIVEVPRDSAEVLADKVDSFKIKTVKKYRRLHKPDDDYVRDCWEFNFKGEVFKPTEFPKELFEVPGDYKSIEQLAFKFQERVAKSKIKSINWTYRNTHKRWMQLEYGGYMTPKSEKKLGIGGKYHSAKYSRYHGVSEHGYSYMAPAGFLRLIEAQWNILTTNGMDINILREFLNHAGFKVQDVTKEVISELQREEPSIGRRGFDLKNVVIIEGEV